MRAESHHVHKARVLLEIARVRARYADETLAAMLVADAISESALRGARMDAALRGLEVELAECDLDIAVQEDDR